MKKKHWMIVATMLVVVTLSVTGIYGLLSDKKTKVNEITVGGSNIETVERYEPPKKLEPGISFPKEVSILNHGPSNCFIRIKAVFTDSDMEKLCTIDYNTKDWIYDANDGYYYYKKALKKGEQTEKLFTTVTIKDTAKQDELKDFDILVYAESFQQGTFQETEYEEAWDLFEKNSKDSQH